MSRRDDDDRDDAPATPAEAARAAGLGRRIDDLLDGEPTPPAMDADERALLETAGQIVASTRLAELSDAGRRRAIDGAFAAAPRRAATPAPVRAARRIERLGRALPWTVAAAAAAAAIALFVTRPARLGDVAARAALPIEQRSRPSDPLIGPIPRDQVDAARARIDVVFADRLAGYRALALRGRR